ncbi:TPA: hypothetical protein ACX96Z_001997 [Clostridium sporogenes]
MDNTKDIKKSLNDALLKRALGYDYEETEIIATKDGKTTKIKKIKKVVPPDTKAIELWFKINRKK